MNAESLLEAQHVRRIVEEAKSIVSDAIVVARRPAGLVTDRT